MNQPTQAQISTHAAAATTASQRVMDSLNTFSLERMVKAGVSLELARWYHCIGARLSRLSEEDTVYASQLQFHMACAAA